MTLIAWRGGGGQTFAAARPVASVAAAKHAVASAAVAHRASAFHRLVALPRLLAAGSRNNLWLTVPARAIEPAKPAEPAAGPQFLLLSHALNARHGNAALWRQVSTGAFTGNPLCALAAENPESGALKQGVYLFFRNGSGVCFGLKESVSIPALEGKFSPVAAAGAHGNVYLLIYGTLNKAKPKITSPSRELLKRIAILDAKMMAPAPAALRPAGTQPANAQKPASVNVTAAPKAAAVPPKSAAAPATAAVSHQPKIASAKIAAPTAPTAPAIRTPVAPNPAWHLMRLHDGAWSTLPPPKLPSLISHSLVTGRTVMLVLENHLIVFQLTGAHVITSQSMELHSSHLHWSALPDMALSRPTDVLLAAPLGRHGIVAWASTGSAGRTELDAMRVGVNENGQISMTRWGKRLLSTVVGSDFADVAMGRDGDCFAILLRQPGRKLTQYTFNQQGRLLQAPESVVPLATNTDLPSDYERLVLAALIVLLALSVWRRKEPFGSLKVTPKLQVARLYRRFAAAGIDLALAALVVMVVFHLYTRQDWVKMASASLDLLFNPQNLIKAPQFLCLLGLYEAHVTIVELIFARSIGKWLLGLYVVDMNGRRAGFVPLLTRNLFRIPEMIAVVVLVFMFVSTDRQRIGDILAQTVVVQNLSDELKQS
jgi:uncharacterized RDD family membrane protein YckC